MIRIASFVVIVILAACIWRNANAHGDIQQTIYSPDNAYRCDIEDIRGFTRDSTLIRISEAAPSVINQVLGRSRENLFQFSGPGKLSVRWRSKRDVLITCLQCSDTDSSEYATHWRDVKIAFDVRPTEWQSGQPLTTNH